MGLDALLERLAGKSAAVTPVTLVLAADVTAKPALLLACTPVTPVTPPASVTELATRAHRWLLHFPDAEPLTVTFDPATTHADAPAREYCPTAQLDAVPLVDPAGHAYPAVQPPEHADEDRPVVSPYLPRGHDVHEEAPLREYVPVAHTMSVGVVDPPGHA